VIFPARRRGPVGLLGGKRIGGLIEDVAGTSARARYAGRDFLLYLRRS
jgi:hypothetical protein